MKTKALKVTSSFTLANKLILFINTEVTRSQELKALIEVELGKHGRGFNEVVVIGAGKTSETFFTA